MASGLELHSEELIQCAADAVASSGLLGNRYFVSLQSGEMSLETFQNTQRQFYFAVNYFSRPMSALLMRLPAAEDRVGILENVVEEHGDFRSEAFHEATFRQFLLSIGADGNRPPDSAMSPVVHAFNATIMAACLSDETSTGAACLGIIEYAFADLSAIIGKAVVQRGWLEQSELVHYKLHAEIDKQHAADFFRLIEPDWKAGRNRTSIAQGLRLGCYAFDRLYRDLLEV